MASLPGRCGQHAHAPPFENAAEREDIAGVVIDQERRAADEALIRGRQPFQHALLFRRQVGNHAMQEQGGFIEEPFRRLHSLDDDAPRHRVEACIFFRRKFAAGEHNHRQVRELRLILDAFQELETGHVG